ncbi:MAG: hypothetical protein KJ049_10115 [Gammaproteobacteria bacterium]|jgi:hypothetical protein|nr:hypothetical protein [Gammaproteobacteria bacterium]
MFPATRRLLAAACGTALGLYGAVALAAPVFSVSVNGDPAASFEDLTVCDGITTFACVGSGSEGDLLVSYFELSADPGAYVAGSFSFYNASSTETLSVLATVLLPMTGSFATPMVAAGTGLASPIGGDVEFTVSGLVDYPSAPLVSAAGCLVADFDTAACSTSAAIPGTLSVLANIGFSLAFDIAPDTNLSIGFDPESEFGAGTFFSITPAVVPVPAAAWLLFGALAATLPMRRRL